MEESLILLLTIMLIMLLFHMYGLVSDKNKEIEILKFDIELLNGRVNSYKAQYDFLKNTVNTIDKYKVNNNHQILEAVKYAMKKSHPDNGGNAEDFKKFRDLYNSMK